MSEQLEKMFEKLVNNLDIDPSKHMVSSELSADQEKVIKSGTDIFEDNIDGDIKKFGGKLNEEEFKKIDEELKKRMENPIFKPFVKDLEKIVKKWIELKKEELNSYVFAIIPVKDLPYKSISFLTVPRIGWVKGKLDKMQLTKQCIGYAGEILGIVTRTTLYGKMTKEEPLFAPHIGQLDLAGYKPDPNDKTPMSENLRFILEIINSMERKTTQTQVVRYHDQYERHGEPICDFLMKDEDLKKSLEKLTSAIESKRQSSNAAIPGIVLPIINTSMVITLDESTNAKKYEICFEAFLKLGAASYETPNIKKGSQLAKAEAAAMTQANIHSYTAGQGVGSMIPQTPHQPSLPVWTEDELAEEAKKRGVPASNLPVWTEDELADEAKKRGTMVDLPVWTEEDLEKENKRKQGAFNIPEWKEDDAMPICPNCGYTCRPGWPTCPVCGSEIGSGSKPTPTPKPTPAQKPSSDAQIPQKEEKEPEKKEEAKVEEKPEDKKELEDKKE